MTDFQATTAGKRIVDDGRLGSLVNVFTDGRYPLGLEEVEPDILGRAYEYLLRMFAEGQVSPVSSKVAVTLRRDEPNRLVVASQSTIPFKTSPENSTGGSFGNAVLFRSWARFDGEG